MQAYLVKSLIILILFLGINIPIKAEESNIKEYHYIWVENMNIFKQSCRQCNDSKDIYYLGKLVVDEDKKTLKFEYVDGLTNELKEFSRIDFLLNREDLNKNIFDFPNIIDGRNRRMISSDLGNRLFLEKKINLEFNKELQDNVMTKVCYICKYKPKPLVRYKPK